MSAHALLSPSAAHRWLNCTPSARLEEQLPDITSPYASEGVVAHSVSELTARKKFTVMKPSEYNAELKNLKANPLWNDEMLTTAATYVEHLTERAMCFEHTPYVALEVGVDISDFVPEAFGTCDCVMIGGNELIITDFKYGKGVPVSAVNNPQMRLYALGALKRYLPIYGDKIRRVSCYIDQPRLNSYEGETLTVEELLDWGEREIKPQAALAFNGAGDFNPGDWCRFCRAKAQCRARSDAHTALEDFMQVLNPKIKAVDAETGEVKPLLSNEEIGSLLERGKSLAEWYEALKEYALLECLKGETIPGWKAVEGRSNRAWSDADKALETIINAGFDRAVVYDCVPKSLTRLEKDIGKKQFAELVGSYIIKPPGKPALAPESDSRPVYSSAAADFTEA